jgi:hypothetical protein
LDIFLYSITYLPIKNINKYLTTTLGNTDDVKFNLYNILDFEPIKNNFKLYIFPCKNGMIFSITFNFIAEFNMRLIYDYFYALKEKQKIIITIYALREK